MIEAGKYICPVCGEISSRAFYNAQGYQTGVVLLRDAKGRYIIHPAKSGNHDPAALQDANYELLSSAPSEFGNGMPNKIYVRDADTRESIRMDRCCPECKERYVLWEGYGTIPTYVVALAGASKAGKTAWLKSISAVKNQLWLENLLNKRSPENRKYKIIMDMGSGHGSGITTPKEGMGDTKCLYIATREDGEPPKLLAAVVLRDFGGELFGDRPLDLPFAIKILAGAPSESGKSFDGPDAYFLFVDGEQREEEEKLIRAYHKLKENRMTDSLLIGIVVTHADRMIQQKTRTESGRDAVPLLTKHTFRRTGISYTMDDLFQRMELENLVAKQAFPPIALMESRADVARGFVVQSCQPLASGTQQTPETGEDYTKSFNIYDPLLWILNRLGLFPLL